MVVGVEYFKVEAHDCHQTCASACVCMCVCVACCWFTRVYVNTMKFLVMALCWAYSAIEPEELSVSIHKAERITVPHSRLYYTATHCSTVQHTATLCKSVSPYATAVPMHTN